MATAEPEERDTAAIAAVAAAAIGGTFAVAAGALYGGRAALSVAIGAIIAVSNLVMLRAIIRAVVRPPEDGGDGGGGGEGDVTMTAEGAADAKAGDGEDDAGAGETRAAEAARHKAEGSRGGAAWGLFALLKIFVLFGGVWLLLTRGLVDPIPLVVGYGVLPLGIAASTVVASLAPQRRRRS